MIFMYPYNDWFTAFLPNNYGSKNYFKLVCDLSYVPIPPTPIIGLDSDSGKSTV